MKRRQSKPKHIFRLFLVPLLLLVVMQAVLSFGTVIFGGTFSALRNYSIDRLSQVTETRQIILENNMVQQWSAISEEYETANQTLSDLLSERNVTLDAFFSSDELQQEFLTEILPTWGYMMRKNSTTGVFIILGRPDIEKNGGPLNSIYIRDSDPDSNPADYSDFLLSVGSSNIAKEYRIPFDLQWKSKLSVLPLGGRAADDFFYQPYMAAKEQPKHDAENLCYWSRPFCLEDNSAKDSYYMVTYSVPLSTEDGELYGVMGIEISIPYLTESIPYREINSAQNGGYLILEPSQDNAYDIICSSGPLVTQAADELGSLEIEPTKYSGLYLMKNSGVGESLYLVIKPLRLYNTNTPFYSRGWYLAGVETHSSLFGLSSQLLGIFIAATLSSLAIAVLLAYLLVNYITGPIRRLHECIAASRGNELNYFETGQVVEVDNLYSTISSLMQRQKQAEYDLLEEKERYRLALRNNSDILINFDMDTGRAIFYNLQNDSRDEIIVNNLLDRLKTGDFIHPSDKRVLIARIQNMQSELSIAFRSKWYTSDGDYQWFELNGKALPATDDKHSTFIGSMHNINDRKQQDREEYELLHIDPLTHLYRRTSGLDIVRNSIQGGHKGCLLLMDVKGFLHINEQFGLVVGDTILEELGNMMLEWKQSVDAAKVIFVRIGGDEFMAWLEDYEPEAGKKAAAELCRRTKDIYPDKNIPIQLMCGIAISYGSDYNAAYARAEKALAQSIERNEICVSDDDAAVLENVPHIDLTPIEHISMPLRNIVPLTFSFFDKSNDVDGIIAVLFPKLGRYFNADDICLVQVNSEFYTVKTIYQWHRTPNAADDDELVHFTAEEFFEYEYALWGGHPPRLSLKELSAEQRYYLRVPIGKSGIAYPLYDNGKYTGCVLFLRSSEPQKWAEAQKNEMHEVVKILESNLNRQRYDSANRAKSDFLSRMSHEIRTPMNAIIGMTYIAQTHKDNAELISEDLGKISQSSQYLLGIINDILDLSRIESGKLTIEHESFNLLELIENVGNLIRPQAQGKGLNYVTDISVSSPHLIGDSLRINQVLINLLGNAVKFTPEGGTITLGVAQQDDEYVRFSVKDTGIGISAENRLRVFEAFEQAEGSTTRQYGGTGLGLAISSRLVRMMGGIIELESELGKGSEFFFSVLLPNDSSEKDSEVKAVSSEDVSIAGLHILLVEDNELNIEIAQTILEMEDAVVTQAHNGQEALDIFTAGAEGEFDLILMDIQMPVMDGLEATKQIRQSQHPDAAKIPIIAMTANAFDEDMKKSVESGMNGHLSKPLDIGKLFETIAEVMR